MVSFKMLVEMVCRATLVQAFFPLCVSFHAISTWIHLAKGFFCNSYELCKRVRFFIYMALFMLSFVPQSHKCLAAVATLKRFFSCVCVIS